jgi:hypothetical protein
MPVASTKSKSTKSSTKPAAKAASKSNSNVTTKFVTEGEIVREPSNKGGFRTAPDNLDVLAGPFYLAQNMVKKAKGKEGTRVKVTVEFI